jgi:hypothetical protein
MLGWCGIERRRWFVEGYQMPTNYSGKFCGILWGIWGSGVTQI